MSDAVAPLNAPLTSHEEVIERARQIGRARGMVRVVVASAEEDDLLAAMHRCREEGIADSLLVGHPERVRDALRRAQVPENAFEIVEADGDEECALTTARIAGEGRADVVMKGMIKTSTLLKTLLKSEHGLRDRELVSHSAVLSVPGLGRLLNITDGGTLVAPDDEQKRTVLLNGLRVMGAAGLQRPRVAVLGPAETVTPELPETVRAADWVERMRSELGGEAAVEGPLPFDLAALGPARLGMDFHSDVAGEADILLVHTLEEGNIIAKTLIQFAGAVFMGVIAGARVPISLVSRSDTMLNKMASVALAAVLAHHQKSELDVAPTEGDR